MVGDDSSSLGRISSGIAANTLVGQTIDFVYEQLPSWRDDPDRESVMAEERLNLQLCKYLNSVGRNDFPMVNFNPEEHQAPRRKVDISATPIEKLQIKARVFTKYDPFLVLEGKRLPTPGTGRQQEYLTGRAARSGGIQRFRLGLHGNLLTKAAMIGYIQRDEGSDWHVEINGWIDQELTNPTDPTCTWSADDRLGELQPNSLARSSRCGSSHQRTASTTDQVDLDHLWIEM